MVLFVLDSRDVHRPSEDGSFDLIQVDVIFALLSKGKLPMAYRLETLSMVVLLEPLKVLNFPISMLGLVNSESLMVRSMDFIRQDLMDTLVRVTSTKMWSKMYLNDGFYDGDGIYNKVELVNNEHKVFNDSPVCNVEHTLTSVGVKWFFVLYVFVKLPQKGSFVISESDSPTVAMEGFLAHVVGSLCPGYHLNEIGDVLRVLQRLSPQTRSGKWLLRGLVYIDIDFVDRLVIISHGFVLMSSQLWCSGVGLTLPKRNDQAGYDGVYPKPGDSGDYHLRYVSCILFFEGDDLKGTGSVHESNILIQNWLLRCGPVMSDTILAVSDGFYAEDLSMSMFMVGLANPEGFGNFRLTSYGGKDGLVAFGKMEAHGKWC